MNAPRLWIGATPDAVAREAAGRIVACIRQRLTGAPFAALALAGGRTPQRLYALLREADLDWERVHVGFTDERAVPPDHQDSNYGMVRAALLEHVPLPNENVHRLRGEATDLDAEAVRMGTELEALLGRPPRFEGVVLGMGADGHTASLFPGDGAVSERQRSVVAVRRSGAEYDRLTLTPPVLRAARQSWVIITGADKAAMVRRLLVDRDESLPIVRACDADRGACLLDRAAASAL